MEKEIVLPFLLIDEPELLLHPSLISSIAQSIKKLEKELAIKTFIPPFEYCTDNAAMIGITAYYKFLKKEFSDLSVIPKTRMGV